MLRRRPEGVLVFAVADMDVGAFLERRSDHDSCDLACVNIKQACAGLAYAHEQSLIHRDLMRENILMTFRGLGYLRVSIADLLPAGAGNLCSDAGPPPPPAEMARRFVTAWYRALEPVFADATLKSTSYNAHQWTFGLLGVSSMPF